MGGETAANPSSVQTLEGLSPRGRGNPARRGLRQIMARSIPAWAGKPAGRGSPSRSAQVYPRVGGETRRAIVLRTPRGGLSPRGRGNLGQLLAAVELSRSIPAWAGKPRGMRPCAAAATVYPRVGGETSQTPTSATPGRGLSPRGRGNPTFSSAATFWIGSIPAWAGKPPGWSGMVAPTSLPRGLSPRGRGNQRPVRGELDRSRSIPAWAGKPGACRRRTTAPKVYPRVGGETRYVGRRRWSHDGLSPRGRGNRRESAVRAAGGGSIPAWAGKPVEALPLGRGQRVYPRVGGETSSADTVRKLIVGLSPRGRGNRDRVGWRAEDRRSIPAWAGKPRLRQRRAAARRVYPRVGGETTP